MTNTDQGHRIAARPTLYRGVQMRSRLEATTAGLLDEMGIEWNLMSATAVMALLPAFVVTLFGQKYVIRGLKI